ncbi:MAG: right-handed parallel beta-helix repeat-containing protein [Flavobacteriia bacterium]|nr:right-handed parallel beta-helix repeat-containing protein [Flavobacteriia bacterium]
MKKIIFLLLMLDITYCSKAQTTYYVATNGDDINGNGSLTLPFSTLLKAINTASEGDVIEIREGTYVCNEVRVDKSNLTIRSYTNENAILQAEVNNEEITACLWFNEPETSGGLLENLEIIGGYYYGIKFESNWDWDFSVPFANRRGVSNVTIRNCHIHHTGRDGIKLTPACNNITIENCEIDHTGIGPGALIDLNAEGIDNVNSAFMTVRNCYFHDIATTGLYVKGGGRNCLIENNIVENTGNGGIYLGFYTDADWFDTDINPEYYENIDGVVKNNLIVNALHAGIGLFGAKNPKVYNNTVISSASSDVYAALMIAPSEVWVNDNFTATAPNLNPSVYNNIFTQNSTAIQPMVRLRELSVAGNTSINNNLYFKEGTDPVYVNDMISGQNMNFFEWQNSSYDINGLLADPMLSNDFHLLENSPCINAGFPLTDVEVDFDGHPRNQSSNQIIDIGADEYASVAFLLEKVLTNKNIKIWNSSNKTYLELISDKKEISTLTIYDLKGNKSLSKNLEINNGTNLFEIESLNSGIYLLNLDNINVNIKFYID